MAMTLLPLASCGPDPDKLMDELLVAGRAGDRQKVVELDKKIHKQKLTIPQALRFFEKVQPKYYALWTKGAEQGDWWNEDNAMSDEQDVVAEQVQTTPSQPPKAYHEPVYLYYCKFCHTLVKATEWNKPRPNSGRCTQGYHMWMAVCVYGTQHGFRCSTCGLEVTTDSKPFNNNSCTRGDHQWKQLY